MGRSLIETVMGAIVLVVAGLFVVFVYDQRNVGSGEGYAVEAAFENVAGIGMGSDVRVGGIKVGTVTSMKLEAESYRPILEFFIKPDVQLPTDSSAAIVSEGLLGSKYVELQPGADDDMLKAGDKILYTQSSINFETMIGKFMFSGGGVDKKEEPKTEEKAATGGSFLN